MAFSQYLAQQVAEWVGGTAMPSAPATVYVGLFTVGGTELAGDGYARIAVDAWAAPSEGGGSVTTSNSEVEESAASTSDWQEATQIRLYDAATDGNALSGLTALETSRTVLSGSVASFDVGELTFSVSTTDMASYVADLVADWIAGSDMPAAPTCYAGWYTSAPVELSGDGYARGVIAWDAAEDTATAYRVRNSAIVVSGTATAAWTASPNFAIHDAATDGNALSAVTALASSVTIGSGGYHRVPIGSLSFSVPYSA